MNDSGNFENVFRVKSVLYLFAFQKVKRGIASNIVTNILKDVTEELHENLL